MFIILIGRSQAHVVLTYPTHRLLPFITSCCHDIRARLTHPDHSICLKLLTACLFCHCKLVCLFVGSLSGWLSFTSGWLFKLAVCEDRLTMLVRPVARLHLASLDISLSATMKGGRQPASRLGQPHWVHRQSATWFPSKNHGQTGCMGRVGHHPIPQAPPQAIRVCCRH